MRADTRPREAKDGISSPRSGSTDLRVRSMVSLFPPQIAAHRRQSRRHPAEVAVNISDFGFPFPLSIDLGLLQLDFGPKCAVLKRKDREFPHVTFFYAKNRRERCWWPHITTEDGRHEELGRLNYRHGREFERRMFGALIPRAATVMRPTALDVLQDEGWVAIRADLNFLRTLVSTVVVGRFVDLSLLDEPDAVDRLIDAFIECEVELDALGSEVRDTPLARVVDERLEKAHLYRNPFGQSGWYFAPEGAWSFEPLDFVRTIAPEILAPLERVAEVLEVPLNFDSADE